MRKTLFIVFTVFLIIVCQAHKVPSGNRAYVSFSKFQSDTLLYAKLNFENNKNFYIGKTVETLINDFELPFTFMPRFTFVTSKDSITGQFYRRMEHSGLRIEFSPLPVHQEFELQPKMVKIMLIDFKKNVLEEIRLSVIKKMKDNGIERQIDDWYPANSEVFGQSIIKDIRVTEEEY